MCFYQSSSFVMCQFQRYYFDMDSRNYRWLNFNRRIWNVPFKKLLKNARYFNVEYKAQKQRSRRDISMITRDLWRLWLLFSWIAKYILFQVLTCSVLWLFAALHIWYDQRRLRSNRRVIGVGRISHSLSHSVSQSLTHFPVNLRLRYLFSELYI